MVPQVENKNKNNFLNIIASANRTTPLNTTHLEMKKLVDPPINFNSIWSLANIVWGSSLQMIAFLLSDFSLKIIYIISLADCLMS